MSVKSMRSNSRTDEGALDNSVKTANGERVGVQTSGYLDKKGLQDGPMTKLNFLPPGQNIEDQKNADITDLSMKMYTGGLGYPGDGWT